LWLGKVNSLEVHPPMIGYSNRVMGLVAVCVALISTLLHLSASKSSPPHIVFILADDLVSCFMKFNVSKTPEVSSLAFDKYSSSLGLFVRCRKAINGVYIYSLT
jgi:hypothetical protein